MTEFAVPLLVFAIGSYVGARFAYLANWRAVAGVLRLLGLWGASAWLGYSTPLYVALLCLPVGVLWGNLQTKLVALLALELVITALLIWYSGTPLVPIYLAALVIFDQLFARLLLATYDSQREPRKSLHRFIVVSGCLCCVLFVAYFYRHFIQTYVSKHSVVQTLSLMPEGAASLWLHKRVLNADAAGSAQPGSVYWESRYPESGDHCAVFFHGAAAAGAMQSTARTFVRSARQNGLRFFAIDHPGYGASPPPPPGTSVDAWDPANLTEQVLRQMSRSGCKTSIALGHSQGVTEALRLFTGNEPFVTGAMVFGAGLFKKDDAEDDYWYDRFHIDRGIEGKRKESRESWQLIRDLYYLNQEYCANTKLGRAHLRTATTLPLQFVEFEREHPNLVATRGELWQCLAYPGAQQQQLPTDHYMDSVQIGDLVLIQRNSPGLLATLLPKPSEDEASLEPDA